MSQYTVGSLFWCAVPVCLPESAIDSIKRVPFHSFELPEMNSLGRVTAISAVIDRREPDTNVIHSPDSVMIEMTDMVPISGGNEILPLASHCGHDLACVVESNSENCSHYAKSDNSGLKTINILIHCETLRRNCSDMLIPFYNQIPIMHNNFMIDVSKHTGHAAELVFRTAWVRRVSGSLCPNTPLIIDCNIFQRRNQQTTTRKSRGRSADEWSSRFAFASATTLAGGSGSTDWTDAANLEKTVAKSMLKNTETEINGMTNQEYYSLVVRWTEALQMELKSPVVLLVPFGIHVVL